MLVSRTMTVSYLPGVAVGLAVPLLLDGAQRRLRVRNFGLLWATALGLAAIWWVPAWGIVTQYLRSAGYGAEATGYGTKESILSLDYWTTELQVVGGYLQLSLMVALTVCLCAGAVVAITRQATHYPLGQRLRSALISPALLLVAVVVEGYLALTSTVNQGTAFALPWLPALVVLAVFVAASIPARGLRLGLAMVLIAACVVNLVVKNGISETFSEPRLVDVPLLNEIPVVDGRDLMYATLDGRGYPVRPPPARLPEIHKGWSTLNERLLALAKQEAPGSKAPFIVVGTGDYFINDTRLELASLLEDRRRLRLGLIRPPDTLSSHTQQLREYQNDLLISSEPPPHQIWPVNPLFVAAAAIRTGFKQAGDLRAPDGRQVFLWSRDRLAP